MPAIFWLWLGAAVIFLIIEITTPGLVFACFAAGALAGAITANITDSYLAQLGVFAAVSLLLIPLTRPLARKITKPSPQAVNVDALLGRSGIVLKDIDPDADSGQVRVDSQVWQATAKEKIATGAKVKVEKISGVRLHVARIND